LQEYFRPGKELRNIQGIQIPFHRQIYHLKDTFSNQSLPISENGSEIASCIRGAIGEDVIWQTMLMWVIGEESLVIAGDRNIYFLMLVKFCNFVRLCD